KEVYNESIVEDIEEIGMAPSTNLRGTGTQDEGRTDAATPEVVVAKAINPLDHTAANKAWYKKVFPVPPGPSMKNAP
ncbi:hypothetical protein HAX54_040156, partial [Datura stramonium]|nr:hypothetical protein [Datura stramonium]